MIGSKIRALRVRQALTQEQLAFPRYSRSYVSQVEHGTMHPSDEAIRHFAARLGVTPADLTQSADDDERRLRHLQRRAKQRREASDWVEWQHCLRDALHLARAMGHAEQESWCLAEWAEGWWERRQPLRAITAYHQAVEALGPSGPSPAMLWLRIAEISLSMGQPERASSAYLHVGGAGVRPEMLWRRDIGQAWALMLLGYRARAQQLFHSVARTASEQGYAVWASHAITGQALGLLISPGDGLTRVRQADQLMQRAEGLASVPACRIGAALIRLAAGDAGGLVDLTEARRSVQAEGNLVAFARGARLEMFALLALDRVESARGLGREVLAHLRHRDGPVLCAWVREPLAVAGAWDGRPDAAIQEALAECAGVYRAVNLGPDAHRTAEMRRVLRDGGAPALRQWVERTPVAAWG